MFPSHPTTALRARGSTSFSSQNSFKQEAIKEALDTIQRDGIHAMEKIVPSLQERLSGEKSAFHETILTLLHDIDRHPSFSQIRQALVEQALDKGFDLNAVDKEGRTALNLAIEFGFKET